MQAKQPKKSLIEEVLNPSKICFIDKGSIVFRIEESEVYDIPLSSVIPTLKSLGGYSISLSNNG